LYGFHLTGVTASGVPLLELTQSDTVSLHRQGSLYRAPRPSVTSRLTSSSNGAVSIDFQPYLFSLPHCRCPWPLFIGRDARQATVQPEHLRKSLAFQRAEHHTAYCIECLDLV
jgi:hypothetical protein